MLALDRLVTASPNATAHKLSPLVDALFKEVQSLPDFDAARFAERLQEFELALSQGAVRESL